MYNKIDEREKTLTFFKSFAFTWRNSRSKTIFSRRFIMDNVHLSFIPRKMLKHYLPGTFNFAVQNRRRLFNSNSVLKPEN